MGKILLESSNVDKVKVNLDQNVEDASVQVREYEAKVVEKSRFESFNWLWDPIYTFIKSGIHDQNKPVETQDYSDEMPMSLEFRARAIQLDARLTKWMPGFGWLVPKEYSKLNDNDEYTPIHVPVIRILHKFMIVHLVLTYAIIYLVTRVLMDKYDDFTRQFNEEGPLWKWIMGLYMFALCAPIVLPDYCLVYSVFHAIRHNKPARFIAFRIYSVFWILCSLGLFIWETYLLSQASDEEFEQKIKREIHLPLLGLLWISFWMFIGLFRFFRKSQTPSNVG